MLFREPNPLRAAEKYVVKGRILDAISNYRKAVDGDPANLTNMNILGDLCLRAGQTQTALGYFKKIAEGFYEQGFWPRAVAMYKKVIKHDPTNPDPKMRLANLYLRSGFVGKARETYLQAANEYVRSGRIGQAREAAERLVSMDPSNASGYMRLGDIYAHERLDDKAHNAYITAGTLFLQSRDLERALDASIKAVSINPESLRALETLTRIYIHLGQTDRAINILREAVEKKPRNAELLTLLGRTYLSAGLMDESERAFLRLTVIDPSGSDYLLEVGEKFLEMGDLDRAAEQIDGCLDVLIANREEKKAINLLRRVLGRDSDHVASLKRLARIFSRLREAHSLIATLYSLVEAATRKGEQAEAIEALKELVRLEPYDPIHRERLQSLGAGDVVVDGSHDLVLATDPLDQEAVFISEVSAEVEQDGSGFDFGEVIGLSLSQYESEPMAQKRGALNTPGEFFFQEAGHGFCYIREESTKVKASPTHKAYESDSGPDTSSCILCDELEHIDFYIAQGYNEIARISLDTLRQEHGNLADILARYENIGENLNDLSC